jgi:hypothetical protein
MSDTDSDVEVMNSDVEVMNSGGEEQVEAPPPTVPKPTKKKKKSNKSKSDAKAAEKARARRQKELKENDLSENDSDVEPEITQEKVMLGMTMRVDKLELEKTELRKEVNDLKTMFTELNERITTSGNVLSGNSSKNDKPKKNKVSNADKDKDKDKSYKLSELTHNQVQSLIVRKENWGDYELPDDKDEKKKVRITKPKLPDEIANVKLREFVEDAVSNEDLLDELDIKLLEGGTITTHNVTKIVKNHCKENDGLVIKQITKDNGDTRNVTFYNLTEGDFEDMFDEYVSSD